MDATASHAIGIPLYIGLFGVGTWIGRARRRYVVAQLVGGPW